MSNSPEGGPGTPPPPEKILFNGQDTFRESGFGEELIDRKTFILSRPKGSILLKTRVCLTKIGFYEKFILHPKIFTTGSNIYLSVINVEIGFKTMVRTDWRHFEESGPYYRRDFPFLNY